VLLPDLQIGIVHVGSKAAHDALLHMLGRLATTPVGVSPRSTISPTPLRPCAMPGSLSTRERRPAQK
jgi:hypothetical protein